MLCAKRCVSQLLTDGDLGKRRNFPTENISRQLTQNICYAVSNIVSATVFCGAPGTAVGSGTALQAGRSRVRFPMVSLDFFR